MVQEISYLVDYNKSIQPNYDKIHLSPSAEKNDADRTKSAGNLVKQCQGFAIHGRQTVGNTEKLTSIHENMVRIKKNQHPR